MVEPKKSKNEIKTAKKVTTPIVVTSKPAKVESKKNLTTITKCDCVNEYQDKLYGKGLRLKNSTVKGLRCSVCGKV
ncbi:MAG: hypothetical protein Q7J35_09680 [Candidatus Methanoperedens sp.]|nr:hypothetical protein [Candidatus Methanoperedens sp.]